MSLVARHLEANGIPTVIAGSALDIVEYCGAPRFLFTDFPLGNPCGLPYDTTMQRNIVSAALDLLETATAPRAISKTPFEWPQGDAWRENYLRIAPEDREALRRAGDRRRASQHRQKDDGTARS